MLSRREIPIEWRTWLQESDSDLLDRPFEVIEGLIETRKSVSRDGKWEIGHLKLTSSGLVAYGGFVGPVLMGMLTAISNGLVVWDILDESAVPLGLQGEATADQVAELVRQLISCGIILPHQGEGEPG